MNIFDFIGIFKKKLNFTKNKISYNTLAISIDNLMSLNLINYPKLIKIDVDGNEIEILNGLNTIFKTKTSSLETF